MRDHEYVIVENRTHVEEALHHLSQVCTGGDYGVSEAELQQATRSLGKGLKKMYTRISEIMEREPAADARDQPEGKEDIERGMKQIMDNVGKETIPESTGPKDALEIFNTLWKGIEK